MMRIFSALYEKVMTWVQHRHAPYYLAGLSFTESSFFPIPPDTMLAPMCLAKPHNAWRYAALTTVMSVLGGLFGYFIGLIFGYGLEPYIDYWGYGDSYTQITAWFHRWDFWILFIAGFTPLPYKIFTIAAGIVSMALWPFVIASLIGRGARFFLVAAIMKWGGAPMERYLKRYIDIIGWATLIILVIAYIIYRLMFR